MKDPFFCKTQMLVAWSRLSLREGGTTNYVRPTTEAGLPIWGGILWLRWYRKTNECQFLLCSFEYEFKISKLYLALKYSLLTTEINKNEHFMYLLLIKKRAPPLLWLGLHRGTLSYVHTLPHTTYICKLLSKRSTSLLEKCQYLRARVCAVVVVRHLL